MKMKKFKEMLKKEITQVLKEFWPVVMAANQGDLEQSQSQSEAVKAPTSAFSSTSGKKYLSKAGPFTSAARTAMTVDEKFQASGLNKRALRLFNPKDTSNLKSSLQAMVFEMADDGFDENETLNFFDKLIYAEVKTLYKQAVK
jgi:hypothetical protein